MSGRPRCLHRRTTRDQRGAVAVEAALVLPLLFTMMFGIIELTMLVRDNVAVAAAARVGVRAATTTAAVMSGPGTCTYREDDAPVCAVNDSPAPGLAELAADAIESSGSSMNKDTIQYILVYKANDNGYPGNNGNTKMPTSCAGVSSCVKFLWSDDAEAFRYANGTWKSTTVNACAGQADAVGIYLKVKHEFVTGLLPCRRRRRRPCGGQVRATPTGQLQVHVPLPAPVRPGRRAWRGRRTGDRLRGRPALRTVLRSRSTWRGCTPKRSGCSGRPTSLRPRASSTCRRTSTRRDRPRNDVSARNGYPNSGKSSVVVKPGVQPSQLDVTVSSTIPNLFGRFIGVDDATITRHAVADYTGPQPMGSPCNTFGNEPAGHVGGTSRRLAALGARGGGVQLEPPVLDERQRAERDEGQR